MNVSCNKCGKKYVIADEKVAGKSSVKIRCKQCQNLIQVSVGAGQAAPAAVAVVAAAPAQISLSGAAAGGDEGEERTRMMPAPDVTAAWFAMVGGKQVGPMDLRVLSGKVTSGEITLRTYLWKNGMPEWKRASDVPEVSTVFAGVSVGATATGPTQPAPGSTRRPATRQTPAVQRDVAVANEVPSPEVSRAPVEASPAVVEKPKPTAAGQQEGALNGLFDDVSLPGTSRSLSDLGSGPSPADEAQAPQSAEEPEGGAGPAAAAQPQAQQPEVDPFSLVEPPSPEEMPPPGEATRFFIAQAGVNKRNPPWKIALFVFGGIGLPVGVLFLLSSLHVIPPVTRTTEDGKVVQENFFSAGGISGLKDILSGDASRKREDAERKQKEAEALAAKQKLAALQKAPKPTGAPEKDSDEGLFPKKPQDPNLAAFYEEKDGLKGSVIPKNRQQDDGNAAGPVNSAGLSQEAIGKVVADKSKAFQACIDTALRRNPNLAVGAITVVLVVGPSGAVKSSGIEPKKHEGSDWGQCMMGAGKRIVFPSSDGETEVQLPFKLGVAISP